MKMKKLSIKKLIALAAMGSAPFAFAQEAEVPEQQPEETPEVKKDPIFSGNFTESSKESIIASQKLLNIEEGQNINLVDINIKKDEKEEKIVGGSISSESINLNIKVESTEGDATAFDAGDIELGNYEYVDAEKSEAFTVSKSGDFKGTFEVSAKGEATGISYKSIEADDNEFQFKDGEEIESDEGVVDLKVSVKGKDAEGIDNNQGTGDIDAGTVKLDVSALALGGGAEGIDTQGTNDKGTISANDVSIKVAAKSVAVYTEEERDAPVETPEAAPVAEESEGTTEETAKVKYLVATTGEASGVSANISAKKNADINVSVLAEGKEAEGMVGNISAGNLKLNVSAESVAVATEIDPEGKATKWASGDAIAFEGDIETGNRDIIYVEKESPANAYKDVSATINVTAKAGAVFDDKGKKLASGDATAFYGDIRAGNEVYIYNIAKPVEKTEDMTDEQHNAANLAAAQAMPTEISIAESKVDLNGSFTAIAEGGTATAIKADKIEISSRATIVSYDYEMEDVKNEKGEVVKDENGQPLQKIKFVDGKPAIKVDGSGNFATKEKEHYYIGNFNADVTAVGEIATAIEASEITAKINGNVSAVAYDGYATAINVSGKSDNMIVAGNVSAVAYDGDATAITTGNGKINLADGANVSAIQYKTEVDKDGNKVIATSKVGTALTNSKSGPGLTVNVLGGKATVEGNVTANSPLKIEGEGSFIVKGGVISASDGIQVAEGSDISFGADRFGNMAEVDADTTVTYDALTNADAKDKNAIAAQKRANIIAGTAGTLVGDKINVQSIVNADANKDIFTNYDENGAKKYLKVSDVQNVQGNMIVFDYESEGYTVDKNTNELTNLGNNVKVNVKSLSYFQEKAKTSDEASLGAALDSIATIEKPANETAGSPEEAARLAAIQERRDFKATVDATADMSDFMPKAQSQLAQVNSEMLMNVNLAKAYRLSSIADIKRNGSVKQKYNENKNAAELISINMLGSQDGQGVNEGFDFWSAGALAAIERDFSDNLLAGISLGGIYNKVEGDNACDANSTSFLIDAYAVYSLSDMPLDIFGNIGYAHSWNEASRRTAGGIADVDYDSNAINSIGGIAYTIKDAGVAGLTLKPMVMFNIVYLSDDSATEEGAGIYNAKLSSSDYINVRTLVGLEAKYDILKNFAVMARAFWVHEFCDDSYDVDYKINQAASYMGRATYSGIKSEKDAALLGLGMSYNFNEDISAFLDYTATIREDFSAHGFDLGVKFKF